MLRVPMGLLVEIPLLVPSLLPMEVAEGVVALAVLREQVVVVVVWEPQAQVRQPLLLVVVAILVEQQVGPAPQETMALGGVVEQVVQLT